MPVLKNKNCDECGTPLLGRIDKRFCSDQCRNTFNNRLNSDCTSSMRNINNVLRRNRRILIALSSRGRKKIRREKLLALGFDFNHMTSLKASRSGKQYYYCYDQGYLPLEKDYFRLITKKDFDAV
jgi:predicted nucleic acid-binding Zn ribbon protein